MTRLVAVLLGFLLLVSLVALTLGALLGVAVVLVSLKLWRHSHPRPRSLPEPPRIVYFVAVDGREASTPTR
jgi:hypothetical protein